MIPESYPELPKTIGGLQKLEPFVLCEEGDIYVKDGVPNSWVIYSVGKTVEFAERYVDNQCRVYRQLAVPKHCDDKECLKPKGNFLKVVGQISNPVTPQGYSFIPQGDKERKDSPMFRGLLGYFPAALFEIAKHSQESDLKHNPGNVDGPTWARKKSSDHADCIVRHLIDAGVRGTPNRKYHLRALAWRACAMLQEECEAEGAAPGVSSRF